MPNKKIDIKCVKSFKAGSAEAFEEVYLFYRDSVYFFALSIVKHIADAEEIVQDTFMHARNKVDTLMKLDSFNSWLFKIAYHNSLAVLRNRKKVDYDDTVYEFTADIKDSASDILNKKEVINAATKEIEKMSEKILIVAKLHYLDGLSLKEISEILGIPVGTVKTRLKRAREIVQPALEKGGFTPKKYFVFALNPIMFASFKQLVQKYAFSQDTSTKIYNKIIENSKLIEAGGVGSVGVGGVSLAIKAFSALTLAGVVTLGVYNATQMEDLEIRQIAYYKEYTNSNIEVEIALNQNVDANDVEIKQGKDIIQHKIKDSIVTFEATKNGTYAIKVKEQNEIVTINKIDRKAPMLFGILLNDNDILQLDVNDEESGIDYAHSYAMQNNEVYKLNKSNEVQGLVSGEVLIRLLDYAGNYTEYAIDLDSEVIEEE